MTPLNAKSVLIPSEATIITWETSAKWHLVQKSHSQYLQKVCFKYFHSSSQVWQSRTAKLLLSVPVALPQSGLHYLPLLGAQARPAS